METDGDKIKRRFNIMAMTLVLMLALAGCGHGGATTDSGTSPVHEEPEENTDAGPGQDTPDAEEASETREMPEMPEGNDILHPYVITKHMDHYDKDMSLMLSDAEWDSIELSEDDAIRYPELAKAVKERFADDEKAFLDAVSEDIDIARESAADFEVLPGTGFCNYEKKVTIQRCDTAVLSYEVSDYWYMTGAAHGMYGSSGYSYDARTGKLLATDEVFTDRQKLCDAVCEKLLSENAGETGLYPEGPQDYVMGVISDGSLNFVLTNIGARVIFNPYEIGPYSSGMFVVELSPLDHPDLIKPEYVPFAKNWTMRLGAYERFRVDADGDGAAEVISYHTDVDGDFYDTEFDRLVITKDDAELAVPGHGYTSEAYFVNAGGRCYLYIFYTSENDFENLQVIDLNGERPVAAIVDGNIYGMGAALAVKEYDFNDDAGDGSMIISLRATTRYALTDPDNMAFEDRRDYESKIPDVRPMHVGDDGVPEANE